MQLYYILKGGINIKTRIISAIEGIPYGLGNIKKLKDTNSKRLRVGDYRIIFNDSGEIIEIIKIKSRGEIYK